ncbi:hypothetical protein Trydic_g3700 [Trypoxylus dichotomus]
MLSCELKRSPTSVDFQEAGFYSQDYADDMTIIASERFVGVVSERVQVALREVECKLYLVAQDQSRQGIQYPSSLSLKDCLFGHYGHHVLDTDGCDGDYSAATAAGTEIRSNTRGLQSQM